MAFYPPIIVPRLARRTLTTLYLACSITFGLLAPSGCFVPSRDFECIEDSNCHRFDGGLCHENSATGHRWCAYPDASCSNKYRYSDLGAGDGVESACTHEAPARCDPSKELEAPTLVPNINTPFDELELVMAGDELMAFIARNVDPPTYPSTCCRLLVSERTTRDMDFPAPFEDRRLEYVTNAYGSKLLAHVTDDGLLLYFLHSNISESGTYVASRSSKVSSFGIATPVMVDGVPLSAAPSWLSPDGQALSWWNGTFPGTVWAATRTGSFDQFSVSSMIASSDRWQEGVSPFEVLSSDQLTLYYEDDRGTRDYVDGIAVSSRASRDVPFEPGVPLTRINSTQHEIPLFLTADGCLLYLASDRPGGVGGYDIWVARRPR